MGAIRVAIVEDESIFALQMRGQLAKLGYEVAGIAASGCGALLLCQNHRPDVVLIDIDGDIDGTETATQLREVAGAAVVYLTTDSEQSALHRAGAMQPDGYLLKPFSERELHTTIQMAIRHQADDHLLHETADRLALALETAELGFFEIDLGANTLHCNEHASALLGCDSPSSEPTVDLMLDRIDDDDRSQVVDAFDRAEKERGRVSTEFRTKAPAPRRLKAAFHATPRRPHVKSCLAGVLQDVTLDRNREKQLTLQAEQLRRGSETLEGLVRACPLAVILIDGDDRIQIWNPAAERIIGIQASEAMQRVWSEVTAQMPRIDPADTAPIGTLVRTRGDVRGFELRRLRTDGKELVVSISTALLDAIDGPGHVLVIMEDITERKHIEQQLRQSQKMEAIGQLTGGMAHDFNNLLGIIIGNLDMLQPVVDDGELVEEALAAALRGADLTRRLLAFGRRQPLNPSRIALNDLIKEVAKLLTRTLGERVHISLDLGADVWPVMVDPVQLEACIINLATNARDAMPDGGTLTIVTANRRLDALYAEFHVEVTEGDYALIEISDSGTGMSQEVLAQIFEPFFTTKGPGKGTGLGLSMVFGFLKQSNGHISAYSEPGNGSTFRLYLPRTGGTPQERAAPATRVMRRGKGETVLVVEDSEPLRRVVVRQLNTLGYQVIEADGADAALETLAHQGVALVFTDIVMPGNLDGFGLANIVRQKWPSTKVLLTSGFPEAKINGRFGATASSARMLSKPYRTEDLARILREVLEA